MVSRRVGSAIRRMRKIAVVICEGETERAYINLLKSWFRSPIKVYHHVEGTKITPDLVKNRVDEHRLSADDEIQSFLMYDLDVSEITEKLVACKTELLGSNPCFELWLLLHVREHRQNLNTSNVIKELKRSSAIWKSYEKSVFTDTQKAYLKEHIKEAVSRAKRLKEPENPSTGIYKLIELISGD